jgi:hypothetical protein
VAAFLSRNRWDVILLAATVTLVFLVANANYGIPPESTLSASPPRAALRAPSSLMADSLLPENASYCELINQTYASPASIQANVSAVYSKLCQLPAFTTILTKWGGWFYVSPSVVNGTMVSGHWVPRNFSLDYTDAPSEKLAPWNVALFTFIWMGWNATVVNSSLGNCRYCVHEEYWSGDLWNNSLSGPTLLVYPYACSCGEQGSQLSLQFPALLILFAGVFIGVVATAVSPRKRRPNG